MKVFINLIIVVALISFSINHAMAKTDDTYIKVVISIDGNIESNLITSLEELGLKNYDILNAVNIITGEAPKKAVRKIEALEKIKYIEEEQIKILNDPYIK